MWRRTSTCTSTRTSTTGCRRLAWVGGGLAILMLSRQPVQLAAGRAAVGPTLTSPERGDAAMAASEVLADARPAPAGRPPREPLPREPRGQTPVRQRGRERERRDVRPAVAAAGRDLQAAIQAIEDARPALDEALAPLRRGLRAGPGVQALAVRAMGRLERPSLVPEIAPLLDSQVPAVRIEAATALGQAVIRAEAAPARAVLAARARLETDAAVLGEIARTIGRLPYRTEPEIREAERLLIEIAEGEPVRLLGVAHGFDALARRAVKLGSLSPEARRRLRALAAGPRSATIGTTGTTPATVITPAAPAPATDAPARRPTTTAPPASAAPPAAATPPTATPAATTPTGTSAPPPAASGVPGEKREAARVTFVPPGVASRSMEVRVRRLAVSALVTTRESNVGLLGQVLRDPDDQVRRLGVLWLAVIDPMPLPQRDEAFREALADASPIVRYEALRAYANVRQATGATASGAGTTAAAGSAPAATSSPPVPVPAQAQVPAPPTAITGSGPCAMEVAALSDASPHVVLLAIDLLGRCGDRQVATDRLTAVLSAFWASPRPSAAPGDARGQSKASPPPATDSRQTAAARPTRPAPAPEREWHKAAHALVALARVAPDRVGEWLVRAAAHEIWQVRMYAARAAGVLEDRAALEALAVDANDNVRHAAVEALQTLVGHDADGLFLAALERSDYQLVRAASRALAGTPRRSDTAARALKAFVRLSAPRRETSRDARMALLELLANATTASNASAAATPAATSATATPAGDAPRSGAAPSGAPSASGRAATAAEATSSDMGDRPSAVASFGTPPPEGAVEALRPSLADFDPVVAARVAALLTAWTGRAHAAAPGRLASVRVPSPREIARLRGLQAELRIARGGTVRLALYADVAPTNVARFVRLARAGYFNGLTFHRVEPNFVLQGGSPGANEYAGDGRFTRDELDRTSNLRGTIGVSTRGRDTGDGQIYVNLVDNVRLDHNYTVFAEVVDGMGVLDAVLEGDVITRIDLREPR